MWYYYNIIIIGNYSDVSSRTILLLLLYNNSHRRTPHELAHTCVLLYTWAHIKRNLTRTITISTSLAAYIYYNIIISLLLLCTSFAHAHSFTHNNTRRGRVGAEMKRLTRRGLWRIVAPAVFCLRMPPFTVLSSRELSGTRARAVSGGRRMWNVSRAVRCEMKK